MYALRSGLSYCVIDGAVVFLDAQQDRYFALTNATARRFLAVSQAIECDCEVNPSEARDFVARNILVEGDGVRPGSIAAIARPATEWVPPNDAATGSRPHYRMLAFACILTTSVRLRTLSFETAIRAARPIRPAATPAGLVPHVIAAFQATRRHLPWRLDCLPASLSLLSYLGRFSISSDLVLAVTIRPFAAHCWVQIGDMVVGDTLERIQPFTPIRRVR
jgi:hypothetical protein